jgi:hypothetical protein
MLSCPEVQSNPRYLWKGLFLQSARFGATEPLGLSNRSTNGLFEQNDQPGGLVACAER